MSNRQAPRRRNRFSFAEFMQLLLFQVDGPRGRGDRNQRRRATSKPFKFNQRIVEEIRARRHAERTRRA